MMLATCTQSYIHLHTQEPLVLTLPKKSLTASSDGKQHFSRPNFKTDDSASDT